MALNGTISELFVTELPGFMRLAAMASPGSATFLTFWGVREPCTDAPVATLLVTNPKRQRGFRRCWLVWHSGRRTNSHRRGRLSTRRDPQHSGLRRWGEPTLRRYATNRTYSAGCLYRDFMMMPEGCHLWGKTAMQRQRFEPKEGHCNVDGFAVG